MEAKYQFTDLMNLTKSELIAIILNLQDRLSHLEQRLQQIEGQLHKDSHNSHLPPSKSLRLPIKNLREKTGKPPGGQNGHPGQTLQMQSQPTRTITYPVTHCEQCGRDLSLAPVTESERRQVFDIPPIICEVTEYQVENKRCACGHVTSAVFPDTVSAPVQYGLNLQTLVSLLSNHEYVGYKRISDLMEYLTGYRMNEATIWANQAKLYTHLTDFEEQVKRHLIQSEVIGNDETGLRIEGKRQWAHVTSTRELTHYAVDPKRGKEATDRIGILPHFQGRTVHDDWKPYYEYTQCRHSSCNVHHLRELTFFEEEEKASWARPLKDLLLAVKSAVEQAKNAGQDHLDPKSLQVYSQSYSEILVEALEGLPPPLRTGKRGKLTKTKQRNFIERLLYLKESVLAFMYDFRVPFDNNLAERDIRMMKLKDKVSGTFRSLQGARYFARIRSYISTVQKQGRNIFREIKNALSGQPFLLQEW
jgi:transposase